MQREVGRVRAVVAGVYFRDGVGLAVAERVQEFLRLPTELIEIGVLAQRASGRDSRGHDELLSWAARWRRPMRPVSARSGRKEFIEATGCRSTARWTQSFPRTRRRPMRQVQHSRTGRFRQRESRDRLDGIAALTSRPIACRRVARSTSRGLRACLLGEVERRVPVAGQDVRIGAVLQEELRQSPRDSTPRPMQRRARGDRRIDRCDLLTDAGSSRRRASAWSRRSKATASCRSMAQCSCSHCTDLVLRCRGGPIPSGSR